MFAAFLAMTYWFFGRDLYVDAATRDSVLALDEREVLTDPRLLRLSLGVIGATVVGFLLAKPLGLEPGAIALLGAAVLMLLARSNVEEVLHEVEWATLFFFVGLFMLVEAVVHVGIVGAVADGLIDVTGGDPTVTTIALLWLSGIASAIIDNIPYTAAMIPVVQDLGAAASRSNRFGGPSRWEPASAGTPRSSAPPPTSSSRTLPDGQITRSPSGRSCAMESR